MQENYQFSIMTSTGRFFTKDGTKHPITPRVSAVSPGHSASENKSRLRILTRKEKSIMRTLRNPMLYSNFLKKIQKLNPHFDEQLIDRDLEPEEALHSLKKMIRDQVTGEKTFDSMQEYRRWLEDQGISNTKLQNMIMMDDKPPTEEEIGQLTYALHGRTLHAKLVDRAKKAKIAKNFRQYAKHPERFDMPGVDTQGTKTDLSEKLGI